MIQSTTIGTIFKISSSYHVDKFRSGRKKIVIQHYQFEIYCWYREANDISQQFPFEESHIFRTPVLLVEIY
jgi:hypothetical protein